MKSYCDEAQVDTGTITFSDWQGRGYDRHSVIADPLFINVQKDDYRLKAGSPALKLGFQPTDLAKIGPRKETASDRG